jgi:hypothetical protein
VATTEDQRAGTVEGFEHTHGLVPRVIQERREQKENCKQGKSGKRTAVAHLKVEVMANWCVRVPAKQDPQHRAASDGAYLTDCSIRNTTPATAAKAMPIRVRSGVSVRAIPHNA